jgi:hypothetical protein
MLWPSQMTTAPANARPGSVFGVALLLLPAGLVGVSLTWADGIARSVAVGVSVTLAFEGLFLIRRYGTQRAAEGLPTLFFYAAAALVLRFNAPDLGSPNINLLLAVSLIMPVALIVRREVALTPGNMRRAKFLIRQLLARPRWPATFAEYRECPLIRLLREGLRENAAPVLPLLSHEDVRVQVAALTALEFQPSWRKGQVEAVFQCANFSGESAVRAAACLALANVVKNRHVQSLVAFMRDLSPDVRMAAANAVLWDANQRWPDVRGPVRLALAAPEAARDGPLPCSSALPAAAIDDLATWAGEAGAVGKRATQTLVRHCKKAILEDGSAEAIGRVTALVCNAKVPPAIRVEVAHRLQASEAFPLEVAQRMLAPGNPTMIRVLAAGAILGRQGDPRAVEMLREAARQPNREIALAAAGMIQKYLSVDMGLPVGGDLPAANTREAAEITRKVLKWASDPGSQSGEETPSDAVVPASDAAFF